jgi:hypothetical protein
MRVLATTCAVIMAAALSAPPAEASTPRPVVTQGSADGALQLLVDGGQLLVGSNEIVLEFAASPRRQVDQVTLVASQAGAASDPLTLTPHGPNRYHGIVVLAMTGSCRLQVSWWEDRGHRTLTLTAPVVVGHH